MKTLLNRNGLFFLVVLAMTVFLFVLNVNISYAGGKGKTAKEDKVQETTSVQEAKTIQDVVFIATTMEYGRREKRGMEDALKPSYGGNGERQCKALCSESAGDIREYMEQGWRVVTTVAKEVVKIPFKPEFSEGCKCIGTEYIIEKQVNIKKWQEEQAKAAENREQKRQAERAKAEERKKQAEEQKKQVENKKLQDEQAFKGRFKLENGVIEDLMLGLQWATVNGQAMNHYDAEKYAQNLSLAGDGWRLPTRAELKSLCDTSKQWHIDPVFNINQWALVWTSELYDPSYAWHFNFGRMGEEPWGRNGYLRSHRVLAVRSRR